MLKLLHTSDLHLGAKLSWLGDKSQSHRKLLWTTLDRLIDLAIKEQVQLVLFSGDVFDSYYPDDAATTKFTSALLKLAQNSIYSVIIPGNHDLCAPGSIWTKIELNGQIKDWTCIALPKKFMLQQTNLSCNFDQTGTMLEVKLPQLNARVVTRPVTEAPEFLTPLTGVAQFLTANPGAANEVTIVMAHGSVEIGGNGLKHNISQAEISRLGELGVDYVALGDWHSVLEVKLPSARPTVWYSGSPEFLRIDQTNAGQCLVVEFSDAAPPKVTKTLTSLLKLQKFEFNLEQLPPEQVLLELKKVADPNVIADVQLRGDVKLGQNIEDLVQSLEEMESNFYYLTVRNNTNLLIDQHDLTSFPAGSIPANIISLVEQKVSAGELNSELGQAVLQLALKTVNKK